MMGESVPLGRRWEGGVDSGACRRCFVTANEVVTAKFSRKQQQEQHWRDKKVETVQLDSDSVASGAGEHRLGIPVQPPNRMETIKPNTSSSRNAKPSLRRPNTLKTTRVVANPAFDL